MSPAARRKTGVPRAVREPPAHPVTRSPSSRAGTQDSIRRLNVHLSANLAHREGLGVQVHVVEAAEQL
jgi:hypothetical protein